MKSWLGSFLLLATLWAFGCTHGEPKQALAAGAKSLEVDKSALVASQNGEGDAARSDDKSGDSTPKPGAKAGRKFALLVGVTKYDKLKVNELIGPANDVQLMREVLKDRFDFTDKDIVILADCPGSSGRPTRANIKSHFDRLTKEARPGDQMVILFGGHGENQPETVAGSEPDGLDQIFLPCDAGPWNEKTKKVDNAIIDDELGLWTKAITDRGASLWVIVDACHSGTMLRGDEVDRGLPEGTLVPVEVLREARKAAASRKETTRGEPDKPAAKPDNPTPRLMALYACQRDQTAPELTAPSGGKVRHGLLTYTICQVLCESKTKLTYKELKDRIDAKYRYEWFRTTPIPLIEGLDQDTEVLGTSSWAGRSQFILSKKGDGWSIRAGQLHGLTEKSILAVFPPAGAADADKVVGHVRIRTSSPTEAEAEPCAYAKMPAPKELSEGGRCALVYVEYGSMGLRVGIEGAGKDEGDGHRRARQMLMEIAKDSNGLIELADDARPADVLVRLKEGKFYLFAADIAQHVKEPSPGTIYFGPYSSEQIAKMQEDLKKIARARNLLKLVADGSSNEAGDLEVEMLKFKNDKDKQGVKLQAGPKGKVVQPGEWVGWRITNTGRSRVTLDVTLLFINSQYGIQPIFPRKGEAGGGINRFRPDQPSFLIGPFPVTAKTVGLEHMVVIAVKADGQPIDFTCLAQPTLEGARGVVMRGREEQTLGTPLGRMLKSALYGQGTTRDLGMPVEPDAQVFRVLSWSVPAPQKSEKN